MNEIKIEDLPELKEYLSIQQTALMLNITKQAVRKLINTRELTPVYRVDKFFLIPHKTIDSFIKKRRNSNISDNRFKIK